MEDNQNNKNNQNAEQMEKMITEKAYRKFGRFPEYPDVKDYLFPQLCRKDLGYDFPEEIIEIGMLDFMIRVQVLIDKDEGGIAAFPVTMTMMDKWDLTMEQLLHDAVASGQKLFPARIMSIDEAIEESLGVDLDDDTQEGEEGEEGVEAEGESSSDSDSDSSRNLFYVLTNGRGRFGASALLYENVLHDFAEQTGESFFIIPSSVHEVLLVPDSRKLSAADLKETLLDINGKFVNPQEILGEHIYHYDTDSGLRMADTEEKE